MNKGDENFIPLWWGWAMIIRRSSDDTWIDESEPTKILKLAWLKMEESLGIYGRGFIFFKYCVLFAKAR
jgi:hypothetical protein